MLTIYLLKVISRHWKSINTPIPTKENVKGVIAGLCIDTVTAIGIILVFTNLIPVS